MNLDDLTFKPVSPDKPVNRSVPLTSALTSRRGEGTVVPGAHLPEAARNFLIEAGQDPDAFEIKSMWQDGATGELRYSFKARQGTGLSASLTDAELDRLLSLRVPEYAAPAPGEGPSRTALVLLGDMQFGKIDGDGFAGTIMRLFNALDAAKMEIERELLTEGRIERIVVAFLGDHIEGFVSQEGKNAWRTPMPLTEQIRVTRRTMLYALEIFGTMGLPLDMVAVPGNHGEAVRFQGSGVTRYDDSLDTESLIAVADGVRISAQFDDVRFFVPETDELSVGLDCSGTYVVFTHGHMSRNQDKLMEWVKGQAFNRDSIYAGADLVATGHYHSFYVKTDSDRTVFTVPSFESESTWYRHRSGTTGDPGLVVAYTGQGRTDNIHLIR